MFKAIITIIKTMLIYAFIGIGMWHTVHWTTDLSMRLNTYMHPILSTALCCILACVGAMSNVIVGFGAGGRLLFRKED